MSAHDIDIELPPLPKASKMYDIPGYDEEELKDYARAAIEADRKRRGEPVYLYRRKGQDEFVTCDKSRYDELSSKPDHFETKVLYTAPQPAEPVKVPSDEVDLEEVRRYLDSWGCLDHPGVRALLARYGKTAD